MTQFKVALVQLNSQDDIKSNMAVVEKFIREAADKGAQFVCTPENTFYMQEPGKGQAPPDATGGIELCRNLAEELNIWILIGSLLIPTTTGKSYNRSLLINNKGEIVTQYDKIHLFDVVLKNGEIYSESSRIEGGTQAVLAETPWGKLGMTVCYDLRFPQLFHVLAETGAEFLTVPSAFTYTTGTAHWYALLRARAIENGCFVFAPAQCGYHPGKRRTYGHSLVVSPWGEIIAEGTEGETGVIVARIDTEKVTEARSMIPVLKNARDFALP